MLKRSVAANKSTTKMQFLVQLAALPVIIYLALYAIFRVPFEVHESGVIVISGASTGIGRHAAEALASKGYHVFAGVRKQSDADSISGENIPTLHPLLLDVTQHDSCVRALSEVETFATANQLPFVALVNNAGISRVQTAEYHALSDARSMFDTNFWGTVDLVQLSLPLLRKSKGRILMISSVAGFIAAPLYSFYAASKFAMEGYSDGLRREVSEFGVSVSVIQPGYVKTPISGKVAWENEVNMFSSTGLREAASEEEVVGTYGHIYTAEKRQKRKSQVEGGSSTQVTTDAIIHAVSNKFPHTRYAVASAGGMPANVAAWMMWAIPDRVRDFFVVKLG